MMKYINIDLRSRIKLLVNFKIMKIDINKKFRNEKN